jgi:hypothetical protein
MNYYNYFTEIEEYFIRRRGKHLLVSPLDWSLIATWRDSGVPLHVALRGIDIAMDGWFARPRRSSEKIGSLFYCHDSVMVEHARYLEAHLGEGPSDEASAPAGSSDGKARDQHPDKDAVSEFLAARIQEIRQLAGKQSQGENIEGIQRVLLRLEEIACAIKRDQHLELESLERDLGILDELLIHEIRVRLPAGKLDEWEEEARKELKVYKKRLPKETYQKILDNFLRGKIRRFHDLGELSLFHI